MIPPDAVPDDLTAYKRTPTFTEDTVPAGLLTRHTTRAGVWARIVVEEGRLRYTILRDPPVEQVLSPDVVGLVAPEQPHEVAPLGRVRFHVVFLRRETS